MRIAARLAPLAAAILALAGCHPDEPVGSPAPIGEKDQYSYAVGIELASQIAPRRGDVNLSVVHQALNDALQDDRARMTADQARAAIQAYAERHGGELGAQMQAAAERNLAEGKAFLDANGKRPGVVTLPSGVQYEVLAVGEGPRPVPSDQVLVRYVGRLADGTVFEDTTRQSTPLNVTIPAALPGWREVLPLMTIGSKYRVFVPGPLAFGERGSGLTVGPQASVVFDLELLGTVR